MGCSMSKKPKKNAKSEEYQVDINSVDLDNMKRRDLQKLCKSFKLKAIGKNSDLVERLRIYRNEIKLTEISSTQEALNNTHENNISTEGVTDDCNNVDETLDTDECDEKSLKTELDQSLSKTSPQKDWNWLARWCCVDGVLKQDAAERWVLLQLIGGRPLIIDNKTKERYDFVLEPTILPTPDDCEDNYICGDCVRKNHESLSGWIGIKKSSLNETPKSSLGKENLSNSSLSRQSFKRKREDELVSPQSISEFIDLMDSPNKQRRLNPLRSASPASPQDRRDRGEDFQLPKNLVKPFKPKKAKKTPPREDPDYAQKVEQIITGLSPEEQRNLVFGLGNSALPRSPQHNKEN